MLKHNLVTTKIFLCYFLFLTFNIHSTDIHSLIKEGDEFYKEFNNLKALEKYKQAYELDTTNYLALAKLTKVYNDISGEYREQWKKEESVKYIKIGMKYAEIFHEKFPDSALTYTYLAWSYGGMAKLAGSKEKIKLAKKIEEYAKKSIQINPNDFMPYIILGVYYREVANLSWFERFFANTFYGNVPEGTYEESEQMLKKALTFDNNIIIANYELANTYLAENKTEDAIEMFNELLKIPNNNFRDKYIKAKTRRRLEKLKS